jgi:hypothetical protein
MRTWYAAVTLATVVAAGAARADERPAADPAAVLGRFVGEWVVDGKWSDGKALHARSVYEWGLGKKILRAQTFVQDGDREYQRYESVLAWHPERKCLFEITFAFDGAVSEYLVEAKGKDVLDIGWNPYAGSKAPRVRQTIRFVDADHFRWTASLRDGEGWKQIIEATWRRKGK